MSDPIEMICTLSGCPREDAERVYAETGNVVDSVDKLMVSVIPIYQKHIPVLAKKPLTEEQITVSKIREFMKNTSDTRSTCGGPPELPEQDETQIPHEETVLQNNCSQKCQLPSLQEGVEKQETVCQSQCECSCDSQCCDQT
jgi:hypothetical protein